MIRVDWARTVAAGLFQLPLTDLPFQAKTVHMLRRRDVQAIFGPGTNPVDAVAEVLKLRDYSLPLLSEAAE